MCFSPVFFIIQCPWYSQSCKVIWFDIMQIIAYDAQEQTNATKYPAYIEHLTFLYTSNDHKSYKRREQGNSKCQPLQSRFICRRRFFGIDLINKRKKQIHRGKDSRNHRDAGTQSGIASI